MGHALTFPQHPGIRGEESADLAEGAPDLEQRSGSLDETFTLLCGEHGRAIDAGGRVCGIEAQL
jgi:hypothetical protein